MTLVWNEFLTTAAKSTCQTKVVVHKTIVFIPVRK